MLLSSSGLTRGTPAVPVMQGEKPSLIHLRFTDHIPGPSRQNKLQKQSVMVRESFWCFGKSIVYSVVLIREDMANGPFLHKL